MDAAFFGGQAAGGHTKASPRPRWPLFAVPAWRELESACGVSILSDAESAFQGLSGVAGGGGGL